MVALEKIEDLTGEKPTDLPAPILDPLLRVKIDVWHAAQLNTLARLKAQGAGVTRPIRVLFLVLDTSLWDVFASTYADMSANPQFAPEVLAVRRQGVSAVQDAYETEAFYTERNIKARLVGFDGHDPEPLSPDATDVLFYTLGSAAYPPALQIEFTALSFLTCYLPYGFLLAREYEYQFNQDFHHAAWRIFAATEREDALYRYYSHRRASNIALTGYPKFDVLYDLPRNTEGRASVIWAPHWTIGTIYPRLNLGMFDTFCMDMLKVFDDYPQIDFVYKPHPTLAHALEQTSFMPRASYETYMAMLRARSNVRVWSHGDYAELFASSAAMITDSVSFLAEYLLADRPLLFLDRADRAKLSRVGEDIIALHYGANTIAGIRAFLDRQVLEGDEPKAAARKGATSRLLGLKDERSSAQIVATLSHTIAGALTTNQVQSRTTGPKRAIENAATLRFFEKRAARFRAATPYTSILYQDKAPTLAEARDAAEKARIIPLLKIEAQHRILDIGCGVGRWADALLPSGASYVGVDASPGLIRLARKRIRSKSATFLVASAANLLQNKSIARSPSFDRILISGLLLYLNDDEVQEVAKSIAALASDCAQLYIREPLALKWRLTLDKHWSDDLEAEYSAIYRTRPQLAVLMNDSLVQAGFEPLAFQTLYDNQSLQNRSDTRQFFAISTRHP